MHGNSIIQLVGFLFECLIKICLLFKFILKYIYLLLHLRHKYLIFYRIADSKLCWKQLYKRVIENNDVN